MVLRAAAAVLWPVTVLVLVWTLRKNLGGLVDRVVKAKVPGFELEAAQLAAKVAEIQEDPGVSDEVKGRLEEVERSLARMLAASTEPVTWGQLSGTTWGELAARVKPKSDEESIRMAAIRQALHEAADQDDT